MPSFFEKIYNNICIRGKGLKESYGRGSNLHKHHIIPKHMGGLDTEENLTYLSIREHIIAHYLLWKIHKNPNDLRSMKMLGAKLSYEKRKIIGIFCRDNKIGFHKFSKEERSEMAKKQLQIRLETNNKNEWDFWASAEGRKLRSSLGGKKTAENQNYSFKNYTDEQRKLYSSMGGEACPKYPVYNKKDLSIKKFHTEEERNYFLETNKDWESGFGPSTKDKKILKEISKKSHETYKKRKESGVEYSTITVTNGVINKRLKPSEVEDFLAKNSDWKRGYRKEDILKRTQKRKQNNLELKRKYIHVTNGKENRSLLEQDIEKFLSENEGWYRGQTRFDKEKRRLINNGIICKSILEKDLQEYLQNNKEWTLGRLKKEG